MTSLNPLYIEKIVKSALIEDIGSGDITSNLTIQSDSISKAYIVSKEKGVMSGLHIAEVVFKRIDSSIDIVSFFQDGDKIADGDTIVEINGNTKSILCGERVSLNFLQRMSGIATLTSLFVEKIKHTKAKIVDTRKTTPGLRILEKYSVVQGGGYNHRFGLDDGILIKDNHIAAVGSVAKAVKLAKTKAPHTLKIEVEITNVDQMDEAINAGADIILLDNMSLEKIKEAVKLNNCRVLLEASGGVNLNNVKEIAEAGVDYISVGELTHSSKALDLSLLIV